MSILTWIEDKKRFKVLNAPKHINVSSDSTKGLWTRCDKCGVILYIKHLKDNQRVCFGCSYHLQMMSQERIENLLDKVSYKSEICKKPISFVTEQPLRGSTKKGASLSSFGAFGEFGANTSVIDNLHVRGEPKGDISRPFVTKQSSDFGTNVPRLQENSPPPKGSERFVPQPLPQKERENMISTWRPLDETVSPCDPLKFADQKKYTDRLQDAQERTALQDAVQTGTGMIDGIPVALAVMDFSFMGGSMGSVVGEKITRLIEYATQEGLTLIIVSASGGARMQEGVFSLMQMAKISSSLQIYQSCANLLYISILTSPTTGGVTASFAMLGDIIFAEPKALIAFAGRRVIEQTLREDLPDDFQTSEYMLHHGLVDLIVPRRFLRQALSESIKLYQNAPFKKRGRIPFGVQNPITFITEEKIRRQWGLLTKKGTKKVYSEGTDLYSFASGANSYKKKLCALSPLSEKSQSTECLTVQLPQMHQCTSLQDSARMCSALRICEAETNVRTCKEPRSIAKRRISPGSCKLKSVIAPKKTSIIFGRRGKSCKQDAARLMCKPKRCMTRGKFTNKTPLRLFQMHNGGLQANIWPQSKKALLFQRSLKLTHERANLLTRQVESANLKKAPRTNSARSCRALGTSQIKDLCNVRMCQRSKDYRKGANLYPATFVTKERPLKMTEDTQYREILTSFKIMLHLFSSQIGDNTPKSDPVFVPPLYALGIREAETNVLESEFSSKTKGSKQSSLKTRHSESALLKRFIKHQSTLHKSKICEVPRYKGECILKDARNSRHVRAEFAKKEQPENSARTCKVKPPVFLQNGAFHKNHTKKFQNDIKKPLPGSAIIDFTTRSTRNVLQARYIRASFLISVRKLGANMLGSTNLLTSTNQRFVRRFVLVRHSESAKLKRTCEGANGQSFLITNGRFVQAEKSFSRNRTSVQKVMYPLGYKERKESRFAETNQKSDINLLNQAIELAATESVEWRAFYIDQQLSENMGFLDNFLQDRKNQPIKNNNILFYKSICRISSGL